MTSSTAAIRLIASAISTAERTKGADYFLRTSGSRVPSLMTGPETIRFLGELVFSDVTEEAVALGVAFGACRYFRARVPLRFGAVEAIALLDDLTASELAEVRVVRGRRGLELVSPTLPMRATTEVHVIVGHDTDPAVAPTPDHAMCYTWYPGRLTSAVPLGRATVNLWAEEG